MSKKRRKQKQSKAKGKAAVAAEAADDVTASAEAENNSDSQPEMLPAAESNQEEALETASEPVTPTPQSIEDAEAFGDAGTAYIEGFLREELGLDGDLTDDEFALAALDFLGDESDGGTVFFNPEELSEMAAQERSLIDDDFDDDAFAKSVEELEEAIAAVSDPEFQKEGTVMVSLPESVGKDAESILTSEDDEQASETDAAETSAEVDTPVEAEVEAVAETVAEDSSEDAPALVESDDMAADEVSADAVTDTTLEVEAESADAPVAEASFSKDELALETVVSEPSAAIDSADFEAETIVSVVSDSEQAEIDEAMRELIEIQAMLDEESAAADEQASLEASTESDDLEPTVDADEASVETAEDVIAEADEVPAEDAAIVEVSEDVEEAAVETVEESDANATLFEDEDLTEEEQALLLEMIAEEEAAKAATAETDATVEADESAEPTAEAEATESAEEPAVESVEDAVAEASSEVEQPADQIEDDPTPVETDTVAELVEATEEAETVDTIEAVAEASDEDTSEVVEDVVASTDEPATDTEADEVDEEEAAILAMMAELEGMDLDSIDLDSLDLNELSAEDALNELASLIDETSEDSAIEAALAQLDAATESLTAEGRAIIEPEQFEETSDYLDTLVAALDEAVSDIGIGDSETLELIAGEERHADDKEQLIVFRIGDSDYAVPIDNVLEVGEPIAPTAVPFVPRWVRGVINLRGEIISLIDLREYFEASNAGAAEWMIVAQNRDASMVVGFIVDDVRGNRQFGDADLAELTSDIEDPSTKYLRRIYQQEEGLVVALDFDKLLNSADMRQFEPI